MSTKKEVKRAVRAEAASWIRTMSDGADRPACVVTEADELRFVDACAELAAQLERVAL